MTEPRTLGAEEWSEIVANPLIIHLIDADRIVAHISELEKALENARKERDVALAHVSRLEEVVRLANAEVDRLKPSERCHAAKHINCPCGWDPPQACHDLTPTGQVAEDVEDIARRLYPACSSPCAFQSCRGCVPRAALSRLAAKAQAHDAAVAQVAAMLNAFGSYVEAYGLEHEVGCPEDDTCECRLVVALNEAFRYDTPGAALLEEHRKALCKARNDALEEVAARFESLGAGPLITSALLLAKNVRAMKEPEQ